MQFWVIGGEFTSLNFHSFTPGTSIVEGPFPTRADAEIAWKSLSENTKYKANYRFVITEESVAKG
jgi:hypothetical protein